MALYTGCIKFPENENILAFSGKLSDVQNFIFNRIKSDLGTKNPGNFNLIGALFKSGVQDNITFLITKEGICYSLEV